ncbi:MSS1 [Candida theae]|uniref:MSS1 n=1 Tax=Candida theae TaxID=1198502 RepID=A0AAD5BDW7_9ASCO|nr:MSS1 [Candida theae]KAI5957521.1 MSS1 [Candida theae]
MFRRLCTSRLHSTSLNPLQPTIYALSTPFAKSAIAVVRISGPQASYVFEELTKSKAPPQHRVAKVRKLYSVTDSRLLDEALTLFFKSPRTYTGLDLLELHLHGGTAIVKAVLNTIRDLHDPKSGRIIRQAEHGEFSHQAFVNGKYDLTALEGISQMINAETESQRVASLASMSGQTKDLFVEWRQRVLENVANLTTLVDFGEDHDLSETDSLFQDVESNISNLETDIRAYLKNVKSSQVLLNGIQLTLLGPPNAGKSSLLNTLSNKDAAIVSDIAGTTRDVLDVPLDIGGFKVVLGDTAGIRSLNMAGRIEQEGIKRAKSKSITSDLVLVVLDPTNNGNDDAILTHVSELVHKYQKDVLIVLNKEDLFSEEKSNLIARYAELLNVSENMIHVVSCSSGYGIADLRKEMIEKFKNMSHFGSQDAAIVSSRVQDILEFDVLYGFQEFHHWKEEGDVVLATEGLRQSVEGIGKITGEAIGVEEILGVVFSNFCIGK